MSALLDVLFPRRCPACRALVGGAVAFCRPCRETFTEAPPDRCPRCCEPDVRGPCGHCASDPPAFAEALTPLLYGGALADTIHRFKYEDRPHYARPLAALALPHAAPLLAWAELVAPVPLHLSRLRKRGYDQAWLLARELAQASARPAAPRALRRLRPTASQVGRDRQQRRANVSGAFAASPDHVRGRRVLLVDDVLTTGATAHEAARAALEAGAAEVRVFALARAF